MPVVITQGAASAKGYGFGASASTAANYIEDVFSTYLYTGTGTTQAISNGIDLSTKGGLVWNKQRNGTFTHCLTDTARGVGNSLDTSDTAANDYSITRVSAFNTDGFTMGGNSRTNSSGNTYTSWTFRKQAKFFDVVTYTGDGNVNRAVTHNLGAVPGCIVIKCTSSATQWPVWHRSVAGARGSFTGLYLNTTDSASAYMHIANVTSTSFGPGNDGDTNQNGATYVAYLFAHNAGGFGAAGTDNVISCGSFTTDASGNATVTLGYEPQWVLVKPSSTTESWYIVDSMRGLTVNPGVASDNVLVPNTSAAEDTRALIEPTATGFVLASGGWLPTSATMIYIAIRRGPMKTPTSGTSVFSPIASSAGTGTTLTTGFPVDVQIGSTRTGTTTANKNRVADRLRGVSTTSSNSGYVIRTHQTAAEAAANITAFWDNTGFLMPSLYGATSQVFWNFRRAPGFFDVVCYTGTTSSTTRNHNLGAVPELIISKPRGGTGGDWVVYTAATGINEKLYLNDTSQSTTTTAIWGSSLPTTTTWTQLDSSIVSNGQTAICYLFGSIAGVSKVGSYTGTGTTKQIDCGFTGGARFVLIKRTDSTGDWYVWDSARGIVAGNDPYLLLNSTAAEVTTTDYVDTYSAGFEISSTAPAAINANGGTFIYLAIA